MSIPQLLKTQLCLLIIFLSGCTTISSKEKSAKNNQPDSQTNISTLGSSALTKLSISKNNWVYTEGRYSDSPGRNVKIYNSLPKGGGYLKTGKRDGYRIFWNGIINESNTPLKLVIELAVDSFPLPTASTAYLKAFILPDVMSFDNLELPDFGVTNLNSLLDNGFKKPSRLEITLKPNEEFFYYTLFLLHEIQAVTRSELTLNGENIFYKIRLDTQPPLIIPCGRIILQ